MKQNRFLEFIRLVDVAQKSIKRIELRYAPQFGVKGVHIFWLHELMRHPEGLTSIELAAHRGIDRSLVSREIADLKEQGLVTVKEDTVGKYNARLVLTEKGVATAEHIGEVAMGIQQLSDSGVTEEELLVFYETFEKLTQNLRKISDTPV